jgi:diadenosine tetraphosphate (Ap4A) HIT family hydrolase
MVDISPKLLEESFLLGKLSVCHILLRNDHRFPWLILVPDVLDAVDLDELACAHRYKTMEDIAHCSHVMKKVWDIEKMNIASIGNIVSQCHVHVVGRRKDDCLWPMPVWGTGERQPYDPEGLEAMINLLKEALV